MKDYQLNSKLRFEEDFNRIMKISLDQTAVSVVITDEWGDIIYVNHAFEKTTGYGFDEVIGKNPRILKSGLVPHKVFEDMWETISNGRPWDGELINKRKDGSIYYEEARISPIIDDGETIYYLGIKQDISSKKYLEEKLKQTSIRDPLTNIYNRGYVLERLHQSVEQYKREKNNFSVAMIDIDYFKNVNDTYGHQAGDFVLCEFAEIINSGIRSYDTFGRYGGEEFILILHDVNKEDAMGRIMRILENTRNFDFKYGEKSINITFSCGIAHAFGLDEKDISVSYLMDVIDRRLYKAKAIGRNTIVID